MLSTKKQEEDKEDILDVSALFEKEETRKEDVSKKEEKPTKS